MRLSRYWMTGCMALVLLAAARWPLQSERDENEGELKQRGWVTLSSRLSADEAVQRLQQAASRLGMPVMAQVTPPAPLGAGPGDPALPQVLVLGRSDGHTPILQAGATSQLDLPLKVLVQSMPDGSSRVMYSSAETWGSRAQIPPELSQDMAVLPQVVQAALKTAASQPFNQPSKQLVKQA